MSDILVVDSSWLLHRSKHTVGDILSHNDMKTGIMFGFFWSMLKFAKEYKTSKMVFCFDSRENNRKNVYSGYKFKRNHQEKTEFETLMDNAAFEQFKKIPGLLQQLGFRHIYRRKGLESDDLIASICIHNPQYRDRMIVISNDNDLLQLLPYCKGIVNAKGFIDAEGFKTQYGIEASDWKLVKAYAGCFDESTEVLTNKGWKYFNTLETSDLVFSMDPKTQKADYFPIKRMIKYSYTGDMFKINGFGIDALVTPNHSFFGNTTQSYNKTRSLPNFSEIHDIVNKYKNFSIPLTINPTKQSGDDAIVIPPITRKVKNRKSESFRTMVLEGFSIPRKIFMAFLGIYLADGYVAENRNGNAGIVGLCKSKPKKVKMIERILKRMNIHYKYVSGSFIIHSVPLAEFLKSLGNVYTKFVPEWVKKSGVKDLKILLHYLVLCDGHTAVKKRSVFGAEPKTQVRRTFYTVNKKLADDFQEIILKTGGYATIKENPEKLYKIKGKVGVQKKSYTVNILKSKTTNILRKQIEIVNFCGLVYDVEVLPHHTILVRRNGTPYWSGNCSTDEVPGIPGFGISTAIKFIKSPPMKGVLSQRFFSAEGRNIIERNKRLTSLPFEGTPIIKISGKDELNWDAFLDICSMYALETFLSNPKNFGFWKEFFLKGGFK